VNKGVKSLKVLPAEFYLLWTDFEPWTLEDSAAVMYILDYFLSIDGWNTMLRERLLEIYDKTLVDKMLPFRPEDYYQFERMTTLVDDDLAKIDMLLSPEEA